MEDGFSESKESREIDKKCAKESENKNDLLIKMASNSLTSENPRRFSAWCVPV